MSQLKLTKQQQQRYNNVMDTAPLSCIINILCEGLDDVTNESNEEEGEQIELF